MTTETTPATLNIEELREKQRAGTLTLEECRQFLAFLRKGRMAAASNKTTDGRKKVSAPTIDVDDLI